MAKPLIATETIYEKAIELVDKEGIEGLSARKLATALQCSPNTLYQQVGKRDEMISGMLAYYFQSQTLNLEKSNSWQESARHWANALRAVLLRHPNLSKLITINQRYVIVDYANQLLKILLHQDFQPEFALRCTRVLSQQVISFTLTEIETPPPSVRRKNRSSQEINFEDLVIRNTKSKAKTQSKEKLNEGFQDRPEIFENAIEFTVLGIEQAKKVK